MAHEGRPLFHTYSLRDVLEAHRQRVVAAVRDIPEASFLASTTEALVERLLEEHRVAAPRLLEPHLLPPVETRVDVTGSHERIFLGPPPHFVAGFLVKYVVPFEGDAKVFDCQPSSYFPLNVPVGIIEPGQLVFPYKVPAERMQKAALEELFKRDRGLLSDYTNAAASDVEQFNSQLPTTLSDAVRSRQKRLQTSRAALQDLGLPIREAAPRAAPPSARTVSRPSSAVDRHLAEKDYDVFLCHNSKDKPAVRLIDAHLRRQGLQPWLDERDLIPGQLWQKALERAIGRIPAAAVFLGPSGPGPWQDREIRRLLDQVTQHGGVVIPAILPGVEGEPAMPDFLRDHTWVDFRHEEPNPLDRLILGIRHGRRA